MRKRIIVAVAAGLVGVMILSLLSVSFFVRRNRDSLIRRAEAALGGKISVEQIEMTFWPLGFRLKDFTLAEETALAAEEFLRAEDLRVELWFLPLFSGQFHPKRIALKSPRITIVRDAAGNYNFRRQSRIEQKTSRLPRAIENGSLQERDIPLLLIALLNISDGTLRYRDLRNGGDLVVSQITLQVSHLDQDQPFEIHLKAAVMSPEPNLRFESRIGPTIGIRNYRDVQIDGEINADALDLGKVNKALPQFSKTLPKALRFDGIYNVKELKFKGTLNNLSLKGAVTGTDASFRFE